MNFYRLVFAVVLIFCACEVEGHFARYEIQSVPIDRVLKHFELQYARNTNDVAPQYYLARIYSIAYATNLTTVEITTNFGDYDLLFDHVPMDRGAPDKVTIKPDLKSQEIAKRHLTNAIFYYQRAAALAFKGTNASGDNQWLIPPIHIGLAWCLDQAGRRDEAINAYRKALKLAWEQEVAPLPSLKEQAEWSWDQLRAMHNPLSRPPKSLGPGICYSEEIIGYLLKLLDPVKDAKEIAQLKKDSATILSMGRAITPILVSLSPHASLEDLVNPCADVAFDLDGSGFQRHWGWITPKAAWLVFDKDGNGKITSGLQMFGNVTFWIFWRDGYDALSSLDDNCDGVLSGDELRGLSLWQDLNGNGICDPGEVRPVTDWGIVQINCGSRTHPTGIPFNSTGVVFRDGSTRATFDWIAESSGAKD